MQADGVSREGIPDTISSFCDQRLGSQVLEELELLMGLGTPFVARVRWFAKVFREGVPV